MSPVKALEGEDTLRQAEVQAEFLKRFGRLFPHFKFRGLKYLPAHSQDPYQLGLRLTFGPSDEVLDLLCIMLPTGDPQEVQRFIARIPASDVASQGNALPVLVAPRFGREARALCQAAGVGYMDLVGNAGLWAPHIYIEIVREAQPEPLGKTRTRALFEGKSERIVRRLLLEPERVWTMRALARAAEVSLGLASMVTTSLSEKGAVLKNRSGLTLQDPALLLDAWADHYDLRRSPYRIWRSEKGVEQLDEALVNLSDDAESPWALTLWSAAQRLLPCDESHRHIALYWAGPEEVLVKHLELDASGGQTAVIVFRPYDESLLWGAERHRDGVMVVHPLQLFLDLNSGDEAEMALAARVRERFLVG